MTQCAAAIVSGVRHDTHPRTSEEEPEPDEPRGGAGVRRRRSRALQDPVPDNVYLSLPAEGRGAPRSHREAAGNAPSHKVAGWSVSITAFVFTALR